MITATPESATAEQRRLLDEKAVQRELLAQFVEGTWRDYGVRLVDGRQRWQAHEAEQIYFALQKVPTDDRECLENCWVVRDDYRMDNSQRGVGGWTHYSWDPLEDEGLKQPSGKDGANHIHLYNWVFEGRSKEKIALLGTGYDTTVLHEVGHLRVRGLLPPRYREYFRTSIISLIGVLNALQARVNELTPETTESQEVQDFVAKDIKMDLWRDVCLGAKDDAESIATYLYKLHISPVVLRGKTVPDSWQELVKNARDVVELMGRRAREIENVLARVEDSLRDLRERSEPPLDNALFTALLEIFGEFRTLAVAVDQVIYYAHVYGGSLRYVEYFTALAYAWEFPVITKYCKTSNFEWFAELYELATVDIDKLREKSEGMYLWFDGKNLSCPTHLNVYTEEDLSL
ncbi:hypothetical protein ACWCQW_23050 [Streptomyces mirabilis]